MFAATAGYAIAVQTPACCLGCLSVITSIAVRTSVVGMQVEGGFPAGFLGRGPQQFPHRAQGQHYGPPHGMPPPAWAQFPPWGVPQGAPIRPPGMQGPPLGFCPRPGQPGMPQRPPRQGGWPPQQRPGMPPGMGPRPSFRGPGGLCQSGMAPPGFPGFPPHGPPTHLTPGMPPRSTQR